MKKISKYEIREQLGEGGMGRVYKAYDPVMEREVAIKVIRENALQNEELKARFYREARIAGKLSHENITAVYDMGEEGNTIFIVMEYLPGKDLRKLIRENAQLSLGQKLEYARQICRGLAFAHQNGVVHRDIKPENIKILDSGKIKIIDFGIAKPETADEATGGETATLLTQAGTRIGTPWYMSPEQVKGVTTDKRADIFSFGVVFYELLTYKKPFEGDDTTVLYRIVHEPPQSFELRESSLSGEILQVLLRCLEKDPDKRYVDCDELEVDITRIAERASEASQVHVLLSNADELAGQSRHNEAILLYNEILQVDPNNAKAKAGIKKLSQREQKSKTMKVLTGQIVGEEISHFKILERLGGGGMGVVYRAEDLTLKRTVALKFLLPELMRDETAKTRFLKEAQAASAFEHPNICTVHEIGETDNGLFFICMSYYGGRNLKELLRTEGRLPVDRCVTILKQAANGLLKAHENKIIHRDIKPANLILTDDDEVKIVDFGLAKLSTAATRVTQAGSTVGTLPFMSPEHVKGEVLDHRSDIWSFGILAYELLTGTRPFVGDNEAAILQGIVKGAPRPIADLRSDVPFQLQQMILKCLEKEREDRYDSLKEVIDELTFITSAPTMVMPRLPLPTEPESVRKEETKVDTIKKERESATEVWRRVSKHIAESLERRNNSDLVGARKALEQGLVADENNADLQQELRKLEELERDYERAQLYIRSGQEEIQHGRPDMAIAELESAKQILGPTPEIKKLLENADRLKRGEVQAPRSLKLSYYLMLLAVAIIAPILWFTFQKDAGADKIDPVHEQALAAKEKMAAAKTSADEQDIAVLVPEDYNLALAAMQRADDAFAAAHFEQAILDYQEAATAFANAITSADELKLQQQAADLGTLRETAAVARTEAFEVRQAADRIGAAQKARTQYQGAQTKLDQAESLFKVDDRENLQAARQAFLTAKGQFNDAIQLVRTQQAAAVKNKQAEASRKLDAALQVKASVPANGRDKSTSFGKAVNSEERGRQQMHAGQFEQAILSFQHAADQYNAAKKEIERPAKQKTEETESLHEQTLSDQAKADMEVARARVPDDYHDSEQFKNGEDFEFDAMSAYESGDYSAAKSLFTQAQQSYIKAERLAAAQQKMLSTRINENDVRQFIMRYKTVVQMGDVNGMQQLLRLDAQEERGWSDFFRIARNIVMEAKINGAEYNDNVATVGLAVQIKFFNRSNNKNSQNSFNVNLTLQKKDGRVNLLSRSGN